MSVLMAHASWFVVPTSDTVELRWVGLAFLGIGYLLTLFSPALARNRQRVGHAQMAVALFAIFTAAAVGILAALTTFVFHDAAGDDLSGHGILLLAALAALAGATLFRASARTLETDGIHLTFLLIWPMMAAFALDILMLAVTWLGAAPHTAAQYDTQIGRNTALAIAAFTAITALSLVIEPVRSWKAYGRLPLGFNTALFPALTGAVIVIAAILIRGASNWYAGSSMAGADLLVASAVIGAGVYLSALARSKYLTHRNATPVVIYALERAA